MNDKKTIQSLSRNFVVPAGTQVVLQSLLRTDHRTNSQVPCPADEESPKFKKPGTVGVVVKCPPHNDLPYTIQFADGSSTLATFDQIILRRQEVDQLLAAPQDFQQYRPLVIYRCQVGSKAFGLSNEQSDDDFRGIFLPAADQNWSLYEVPQQIEFNDGQNDEVYWELEKFLRLALKANPNILEVLWTPIVLETSPIADRLRDIRTSFLSKHLYKTYSGYVLSQFRRMRNQHQKTGTYKAKHAMHLIRLLRSGISALHTGQIAVDVSKFRTELLAVRNGKYSFEEVEKMALELDKEFAVAFDTTALPDQPDFATVDQFLIEARRSVL